MTRPTKLVPLLQQNPKESYKKFLKRVDRVTNVGGPRAKLSILTSDSVLSVSVVLHYIAFRNSPRRWL